MSDEKKAAPAGQQQQGFLSLGGDAVSINGERFGVYFQHSCRYTILAGAWPLSGSSFITYYRDAMSLERVRSCPHCGGELSLHTLDFIDADPMHWYRYHDVPQEGLVALVRARADSERQDMPDGGELEDYRWAYQPCYGLDRLDRRAWKNWYTHVHRHWPGHEVAALAFWFASPWLEPVVIVEGANGQPDLWVGQRNVGISSYFARLFVPAFLGTQK